MNESQTLQWLKDREDIKTVVLRYATGADLRDWEMLQSVFADQVDIDFSSFGGGPVTTVSSEEYLGFVKALIPGFDSTQHQLTNFVIDINGNEANCVAYMQAEHFVATEDEELCHTVGGYYTYRLTKENTDWKVCSLKLSATWSRGDMRAHEIAAQRAASNQSIKLPYV